MPKLTFKNATESDFEGVFILTKKLWPDKKFNRLAEKSKFLRRLRHKGVIVAKSGKKVVGVAVMSVVMGRIAFLDELIVLKKHHRIGTRLLNKVYHFSKQNLCNTLFLFCAPHRRSSHIFYWNHGFKNLFFIFYRSI